MYFGTLDLFFVMAFRMAAFAALICSAVGSPSATTTRMTRTEQPNSTRKFMAKFGVDWRAERGEYLFYNLGNT